MAKKEERFEVIFRDGSSLKDEGIRQILVDKETGVNYLCWKSDSWLYMVYYDSWNSVWKAVFQDGKTFFHAIWCQCDRVEYKNLRSHLRE